MNVAWEVCGNLTMGELYEDTRFALSATPFAWNPSSLESKDPMGKAAASAFDDLAWVGFLIGTAFWPVKN